MTFGKIYCLLKPTNINYNDYITMTFSLLFTLTNAHNSNNKYLFIIEDLLKANTDPTTNILIETKISEKVKLFCMICNLLHQLRNTRTSLRPMTVKNMPVTMKKRTKEIMF